MANFVIVTGHKTDHSAVKMKRSHISFFKKTQPFPLFSFTWYTILQFLLFILFTSIPKSLSDLDKNHSDSKILFCRVLIFTAPSIPPVNYFFLNLFLVNFPSHIHPISNFSSAFIHKSHYYHSLLLAHELFINDNQSLQIYLCLYLSP